MEEEVKFLREKVTLLESTLGLLQVEVAKQFQAVYERLNHKGQFYSHFTSYRFPLCIHKVKS